jgi:hypothetical protein
MRRLLVSARRGDRRMQRRGGVRRQPESNDIWIDPRWKTSSRAERQFRSNTVVEIKQAAKIE